FPERKGRSDTGKSLLTPYKEYILKRWNAGCRDARQLFRTIQRQGYTGSYPTVARCAQRLRQAQGLRPREQRPGQPLLLVTEVQHTPLTTRRATWVVLKQPRKWTEEDTQLLTQLKAQHREIAVLRASYLCHHGMPPSPKSRKTPNKLTMPPVAIECVRNIRREALASFWEACHVAKQNVTKPDHIWFLGFIEDLVRAFDSAMETDKNRYGGT
ncbi:MAG TPA: hypothetical protein VJ769_03445, partial [Actinomycetes bacterium]|nr:hypothetical protein [Actinomycetes bacterium]